MITSNDGKRGKKSQFLEFALAKFRKQEPQMLFFVTLCTLLFSFMQWLSFWKVSSAKVS